jgi:hypothetical protein
LFLLGAAILFGLIPAHMYEENDVEYPCIELHPEGALLGYMLSRRLPISPLQIYLH